MPVASELIDKILPVTNALSVTTQFRSDIIHFKKIIKTDRATPVPTSLNNKSRFARIVLRLKPILAPLSSRIYWR